MSGTEPTSGPDLLSSGPDLLYSETENDLRAAVRSLLTDRCDPSAVLRFVDSGRPYDREVWQALATGMGIAGLLVPEKLGGQGASAREAAVVAEELGRSTAPVPYLTGAVLPVEALLGCDTDDRDVAGLLGAVAAGRTLAVLALPLSTGPFPSGAALPTNALPTTVLPTAALPTAALPTAVRATADGRLDGRIGSVAGAAGADLLLVPAHGPEGAGLYAVEAAAPGVTVTPRVPLDLTRPLAGVTLADAPARRLAGPGRAEEAVARALTAGAGLLASEQLGLAEWCLTETVRYTGERHQFNRPVGSFQALKHRLARLWLEIVSARAAARNAADALANRSPDRQVAVAVAQASCSRVAVRAAEECVQLHGGIGMTWEHPAHLYLKRAKADEIAFGTPGHHRDALARLVDLAPPGGTD
ncbi:acyl-CoA dehydrogenase family protein [Streptomyces sp. NPDC002055]|uniref:acyl-CoA dehydrogenase family protein n=1 Tax=Streptomyces sp. NPDC002055 TaxID=3154534 RepID=UPI00331FFEDD